MKQPELGYKISELRKSKGLTQEELVEICNISVRTIQRIEAGEVTPRSYTVKSILAALDYDLEKISTESSPIEKEFKKLFLLELDDEQQAGYLSRNLKTAWISAILFFILGFGEFALDYFRYDKEEMLVSNFLYILFKFVILFLVILYMRGFVLTGQLLKNYLLRITAFMMIGVSCLFYLYDIFSIFIGELDFELVLGAEAVTYGVIGILFGISVLRLQKIIGTVATVTGIFEIVSYAFMATIIFAFLGFILLMPTIILEIILLYKIYEMVKAKEKELGSENKL